MADRSSDDPKLPHDVIVEILKRSPAESLLRFRCVSRSWCSTIDDPRFVALHLNHSNSYLVCLDQCDPLEWMSLFSNESLALPSRSQIIPFVYPPTRHIFVGSCNGLLCFTEVSQNGYGQTMYLWNLFTRKHKSVRQSAPDHQSLSPITAPIVLGFGFDARSNDYKIVRILYCPVKHDRCFGGTNCRVDIYSLRTDSWRTLECEAHNFCGYKPAVFLNGNLHWLAFKFDHWCGYGPIVLFDVTGEAFDEMPLPEEIFHEDNSCLIVSVAVLDDLLAVFTSHADAAGHPELQSVCSVWVMRDYGVPESWTMMYTLEATAMVTGFGGFTWNGELLMETDSGDRVSWNPISGQVTSFPLSTSYDLVTVLESLVSLTI